jgi:FHS family L-fucose permease-like MFS transporter
MAIPNLNSPPLSAKLPRASYRGALSVVTTLFFMWGFATVLNDVLVPHLKSIFDLSYAKVMLVQFSFFSAYFIFSMPAAKVIDAIGYQKTMVVGLFTMGLGALLFIPAATIVSYPLFLGALMVLAAGITALQVAANPYVAVLGPPATASSRLNLAQAFNSLGTTLGPYLGGALILSAAPKTAEAVRQMSAGGAARLSRPRGFFDQAALSLGRDHAHAARRSP